MKYQVKCLTLICLFSLSPLVAAQADVVNVPVSFSASQLAGGPSVWHAEDASSIPSDATNISFTLDSFAVDDKGVVQLNGTTIGDAVIFQPNGGAAGVGTFDFGLGDGNQPYTFVGFTPGDSFPLLDGTTDFSLLVYVNDTGTPDPSAPPLTVAVTSSFNLSGSLTYETAEESVPALNGSAFALLALALLLLGAGFVARRRRGVA